MLQSSQARRATYSDTSSSLTFSRVASTRPTPTPAAGRTLQTPTTATTTRRGRTLACRISPPTRWTDSRRAPAAGEAGEPCLGRPARSRRSLPCRLTEPITSSSSSSRVMTTTRRRPRPRPCRRTPAAELEHRVRRGHGSRGSPAGGRSPSAGRCRSCTAARRSSGSARSATRCPTTAPDTDSETRSVPPTHRRRRRRRAVGTAAAACGQAAASASASRAKQTVNAVLSHRVRYRARGAVRHRASGDNAATRIVPCRIQCERTSSRHRHIAL